MQYSRKKKLELRVKSGAGFIGMAAVIDLLIQESQQTTKAIIESHKTYIRRLKSIEKDLMLLRQKYKIVKK